MEAGKESAGRRFANPRFFGKAIGSPFTASDFGADGIGNAEGMWSAHAKRIPSHLTIVKRDDRMGLGWTDSARASASAGSCKAQKIPPGLTSAWQGSPFALDAVQVPKVPS
jgi:hypothetical protein